MLRRLYAWLRRRQEPDPLAHDTDWHDALDDLRADLTDRRTRRTTNPPTDRQANRGHERGTT